MPRHLRPIFWMLVALIGITAVASLWWPWWRDHSAMAYVGRVILGGGMPYRDAWDINAPGGYLVHAAMEAVVGPERWPLRLIDIALLALTGWCLFLIGRSVHSGLAGAWAAVLFALLYLSTGHGNIAQRDGWMAMLTVWSLAALLSGRLAGAALAGLFAGLSVVFKPTGAAYALPVGLWLLERAGRLRLRRRVAALALFAVVALLPVAAVLAWLAHGDALRDAYDQVILFNSHLYGHLSPGAFLRSARTVASVLTHKADKFALFALATCGAARLIVARTPGRWSLALAFPLVIAGVLALQGKFFYYHWHSFHAALALLAGVGVADLAGQLAPRARPAVLGHALVVAALLAAVFQPARSLMWQVAHWGHDVVLERDYDSYLDHFDTRDYSLRADRQVAAYLDARTTPDDTLLCWGLEPDILLLSDRRSASAVGGSFPFAATQSAAPDLHARLLKQLLADMERSRPVYFIVVDRDTNAIMPRTSAQVLASMTTLNEYVSAHYVPETVIEDFTLLRRK